MATRWKMDADDFLAMTESKSAEATMDGVVDEAPQLTDAERAAVAYCEMAAKEREAGRVPASYTSTTKCGACGAVYIFPGSPNHVAACPWCYNRVRGLPIPRPQKEEADHGV